MSWSWLRSVTLLFFIVVVSPLRAHAAPDPCAYAHASELDVADAAGLTSALAAAQPGTLIRLAPGSYRGNFVATASGTAAAPIVLCGPRSAVLDGVAPGTGYTLHLLRSNYWILSGFSVVHAKDGVMLDRSSHNLITGLLIHDTGQTGISLRTFSSHNSVTYNQIHDTGRVDPGYGEGLYIGTAVSNWQTVTGSATRPDRSNGTRVRYNTFGPNIAAESIDIKEGTTGGRILDNHFDGAGMSGANYADSWIDVQGNGYLISGNSGVNALRDAFQVHVQLPGWGRNNVFADNLADVRSQGYGFMIAYDALAGGNVVRCDNVVRDAGAGLANVACAP